MNDSPYNDIINNLANNNGGWAIPTTFRENIEAFIESINWTDDYIIIIFIFIYYYYL